MDKVETQWTRELVLQQLRADNPKAAAQSLQVYADIFMQYYEATANIRAVGTVCAHPRTAQPIENPYVGIQAKALKTMQGLKIRLRTDSLWGEK